MSCRRGPVPSRCPRNPASPTPLWIRGGEGSGFFCWCWLFSERTRSRLPRLSAALSHPWGGRRARGGAWLPPPGTSPAPSPRPRVTTDLWSLDPPIPLRAPHPTSQNPSPTRPVRSLGVLGHPPRGLERRGRAACAASGCHLGMGPGGRGRRASRKGRPWRGAEDRAHVVWTDPQTHRPV